ncbi:MAG TPA: DNRLRE domain-containing protein [Anaerolineales bacterium]|nr:DNRLRE domain-containing protein [Anaerolineales bacterium]
MFTATQSSARESLRWLRCVMTVILIVSNFATVMLAGATSIQTDTQPSFPIRAAFYYPWFPEAWNQQGFNPFTNYTPSLGFYDGSSSTVIKQQIAAMQYGGIQAGIASWWGQGSKSDSRMPALLQGAAGTSFRWSVYYENESLSDPSVAQLTSDLTYLRDKYGNDPSFLRVNGHFVVFVYADGADACGMADRWKQANTVGAYVVLKVFSGYRNCTNQPDGWHQYSPAVAADSQSGYSYAIAPGFWKKGEAIRLARDLTRWNQNVRAMVASGAPFQLVTTFNEWGEGTSVESAQEWATDSGYGAYLDALHNNGNVAQPTTVPATQTAQPTSTTIQPSPTTVLPTQTTQATATAVSSTATSIATNTQAPNLPLPTATLIPTYTASPIPSPTKTATAVTTGDPVIAAAGDIACDPSDGNFNGGNGTATACRQKATSDLLVGKNLSAVLTLGDTQYEDGVLAKFQQSFDPTWGRVKNIIHPVVGNHEYHTAGASGYYSYFGTAAGDKTKGYYSYDLGAWHMVALNSECSQVGGCGAGSPQEQWLKADLAAHPNMCTLAYWHSPRFSSGNHGNNTAYDAFWKDLYAAGVELVLNGHDHSYERFAPQNPGAAADPKGIQEIVAGMGGKNHYAFGTIQANSAVHNSDTFGVLKLTLHSTSYDWQFIPEAGKTFTDAGTRDCFTPSSIQPTPTLLATKVPQGTSVPVGSPTPTAFSSSLTFIPIADAYVTSAIPNTNYGGSQYLRFDASPVVRSYLTFNVQGLSGSVASVKLKVYAGSSSGTGFKVYKVATTSWSEKSITYNNAPPLGSQIGSSGTLAGSSWTTVDVTSLLTANGTFSLAVTGVGTTAVSLSSRETGARAPQLIITTR